MSSQQRGNRQAKFDEAMRRYYELAEQDAEAALNYALRLTGPPGAPRLFDPIKAVAQTEVGGQLDRSDLVQAGADGFAALEAAATTPEQRTIWRYNHANSIYELFMISVRANGGWSEAWLKDRKLLHEARKEFLAVARNSSARPETRMQCFVNAGNSLSSVGRSLDCIPLYDGALGLDSAFGMALGNRGFALARYARYAHPHQQMVMAEAAADVYDAVGNPDNVRQFGGNKALVDFEEWLQKYKVTKRPRLPARHSFSEPYWAWCIRNGLLLHVSPRCLREDKDYYDPLFVRSVTADIADTERVASILDALNVMKADYAGARWSAWQAFENSDGTGSMAAHSARTRFMDSLHYAQHDLFAAAARQAFASGNDLLDKMASFLVIYLGTGASPTQTYFRGWWHDQQGNVWPELQPILPRNWGFLALCDLAEDFSPGGSHHRLQRFRNAATHRFVVPHEFGPSSSGPFIERLSVRQLKNLVIEQLQIARAALIYLVAGVDAAEEDKRKAGGKLGQIPMRETLPRPGP